jgi:hypothetical protein
LDLHFENWIWIGEGEDWYGSKSLERGESFLKVREREREREREKIGP